MASRRDRQKVKQRRHQSSVSSDGQVQVTESPAKDTETPTRSKKKRGNHDSPAGTSPKATGTPLTASGTLDWSSVKLSLPTAPPQRDPAPLTSRELPSPTLGVVMACLCTLGIVMTGRWSLVLLAVLGAVLLIDPRVRGNRDLLLRITAGVLLCVICLPLVSELTSSLDFNQQGLMSTAVVGMFSLSLWLIGGVALRVARLQDSQFRQGGLYTVGMACRILCVILLIVGVSLAIVFALSQL